MRKIFGVLLFTIAALALASGQSKPIYLRAVFPLDFGGSEDLSTSGSSSSEETDFGLGLGAEALVDISENVQMGGGFQYLLDRSLSDSSDSKFNFVPLYALVRVGAGAGRIEPYAIGRLGYGFFACNDEYASSTATRKGGIFLTIGGGLSFALPDRRSAWFIEGGYAADKATLEYGSYDLDVTYGRFQLCLGVSTRL